MKNRICTRESLRNKGRGSLCVGHACGSVTVRRHRASELTTKDTKSPKGCSSPCSLCLREKQFFEPKARWGAVEVRGGARVVGRAASRRRQGRVSHGEHGGHGEEAMIESFEIGRHGLESGRRKRKGARTQRRKEEEGFVRDAPVRGGDRYSSFRAVRVQWLFADGQRPRRSSAEVATARSR
jgi:hypothetical protein